MAEAAHRILTSNGEDWLSTTLLVSVVGVDPFRGLLLEKMQEIRMRTDGLITSSGQSAVCNMVLDAHGALIGGVADMDIIQSLNDDEVCNRPSM